MPWLPDTNIWIQVLKRPGCSIESRLISYPPTEICLCSVVKAELWHGAVRYEQSHRRIAALEQLFAGFVSYPFDDAAAWHYGTLRHELEKQGLVIGPNDLKIASICLSRGLTLVTGNDGSHSLVAPPGRARRKQVRLCRQLRGFSNDAL